MGKQGRRNRPHRGTDASELNQPRTKEEREAECRTIMHKLTELGLTVSYEGVRELLPLLAAYAAEGKRREISIHIDEIKRRLVGVLAVSRREQVWLKLEKIG